MLLTNELSLFALVVEAKSFKKAAEVAGMSTPALSKRISKLEESLNVQLLYRTTRRLTLTEAGKGLYSYAKGINRQANEAFERISNFSDSLSGHIRITIPTISGELFLAECIAEFCAQYPRITVEVSLENKFVDLVKEGIDLAIRTGVLEDSSLIAKRLITSQWVVCCSPKYIEQFGEPKTIEELINHNCLIYTYQNQGGQDWFFSKDNTSKQISVSGNFSTNNAQALRKASLSGYGISYVPRCSVYEDIKNGDLVELLTEFKPRTLGVYAIYPFTKYLPNKVKLLIEHIKQGYESLSHYF